MTVSYRKIVFFFQIFHVSLHCKFMVSSDTLYSSFTILASCIRASSSTSIVVDMTVWEALARLGL